ncbi:amidohydrolase family protein [Reichenbachiella sp. MALMAid0571]|uniref:amidohydrolase family protein n=1 Tax=Reichenbachiella sp. MALMAid0571 TaxID=3143939 RepID=UPI0032DFBD37
MKKIFLLIALCLVGMAVAFSQDNFPYNGVRDYHQKSYAFINAKIFIDYQTSIDSATLLIKEGKVVNVGKDINFSKEYTVVDCGGKYIYPSFIDLNTNYGFSKPKPGKGSGNPSQVKPETPGAYNANDAIKSYINVSEHFAADKKQASVFRKSGFGTVLSLNPDGIARGTSTLVLLLDENENESILIEKAAAHYSFNKGTSTQAYPSSLMGSVALLRQTYLDAKWYAETKTYTDLSLQAWIESQKIPQFFDGGNKHGILRADKIGDEFGIQYIINSNGSEYQNIKEVKNTNATLITQVNFPKAYNLDDPYEAKEVSLKQMKHWELAPYNLKILVENNVDFAVTSSGLKTKDDFLKNLREAVSVGLSKKEALKSLTYTPANLVKAVDKIGSLKKGYLANFIITSKDIFEEESIILENWVKGNRYEVKKDKPDPKEGIYELKVDTSTYKVEAKKSKFQIIVNDSTKTSLTHKFDNNLITLNYDMPGTKEKVMLSGWKTENGWNGNGQIAYKDWVDWQLTFKNMPEKPTSDTLKTEKEEPVETEEPGDIVYPFSAYGQKTIPKQQTLLIKNITVWTNENQGIVENFDVLVQDGKIKKIGKGLSFKDAIEIDGSEKHLTPGIIDEHSHIALFSVNDVATNSGMVRMKDVVNPEDINIYRQLSGGVTTSQLLHGSANPIGGQSAIIKLKWGESANNMLIENADPFIKFALGENVKQTNWGSDHTTRYPQTRMGVEQVYLNAFSNALEYEKEWNDYNKLSGKEKVKTQAPRKDLVHETMLEIIRKRRFITCHSYVQSEINMLMKVAEKYDFNINTFTHILEGYKVADKMKAHGAGASTFSDWWAYKWEVRYAIPYNAALMHNEGITVAINSDDAEMGRRLNQEAAKSVKYGDMTEEEALKMVTLNPAKLLHLDDRMGSIKEGKDADLVIWSDNPLSVYAKAEKTIIEGTVYYDMKKDAQLRESIKTERARLIKKMKDSKSKGKSTQEPKPEKSYNFHCDDMESGY